MTGDESRIPCPYCGELIVSDALKCRYCREWISSDEEFRGGGVGLQGDTATDVRLIFDSMPLQVDPGAAWELDGAVIQFHLTGNGGGDFYCRVTNGTCDVGEGTLPEPSLTLTMEASEYVDMIVGKLHGGTALMEGRLRVEGDMDLATKLQYLFRPSS